VAMPDPDGGRCAGPIDLRSDTVTAPSAGMRAAMAEAIVGDDVYGEDPTVNLLQERVAALLGKQSALFVPSGTMANQLCVRTHTVPGDVVLIHEGGHVLNFEGGSAAALASIQLRPLPGTHGLLDPEVVRAALTGPGNEHIAPTGLVALENTHNRAGGTVWPLEQLAAVASVAREAGVPVHLDGARLWNACVASGLEPAAFAAHVDSVSVCFSKGLGAPIGSMLAGDADFVRRARLHRKRYGGAMRQVGILAAAALWALDHNVARLADDHVNAKVLATRLGRIAGAVVPHPVDTNIVVLGVAGRGLTSAHVVAGLRERGVLASGIGPTTLRFVTHLDVSAAQVALAAEIAAEVLEATPVPAGRS
jgi:threonine aldolase